MKVSIIVPVYNVERYLHNCIESILSQTYRDFELFLINDGSTDRSGEICEKYKKNDHRITVVHQKNKGQSAARNVGISMAQSEWVLFVDSDDLIHPQMLEYLFRAVEEKNVCMSACGRLQKESVPDDFYRYREFNCRVLDINESTLIDLYKSEDVCLQCVYWLIYPKLIKTSIVKKISFCEGKIFEDNEVSCKWLVESGKIAIIPECMYFYTTNPTGTMQSKFDIKKLDYFWALESKIKFYRQLGYENLARAISVELLEVAFYYYNLSIDEKNKEIESIVKKKIKYILKAYGEYITIDTRIKNKLLKIYHPFLFKLKKKFKI